MNSDRTIRTLLIAVIGVVSLVRTDRALAVVYSWSGSNVITSAGNWSPGGGPPTTGDSGTINTGTATASASLTGSPTLNIGGTGILGISTLAAPVTTGLITANTSGRIEWTGISTGINTIALNGGSTLGKPALNAPATSNDNISIAASGTVTAQQLQGTGYSTGFALTLAGPITGNSTTTISVNPVTAGNHHAPLRIAPPTTANTGFTGNVLLTSSVPNNFGTLVLGGTGALSSITSLSLNSGGTLRLATATNPLPSAFAINVNSGARMEWDGTQTYSVTMPSVTLQNGSSIGKEQLNVAGFSNESISIAPGATVTASLIAGTSSATAHALNLQGPITGNGSTTLVVNPTFAGNTHGPLRINRTTANTGFTGTVTLSSSVANTYGTLVLSGTGALSSITDLNVNSGGQLRFNTATDPLPSATVVDILTGARMEWDGAQTYTVTPPSFIFRNGTSFGRDALNAPNTVTDAITIDNGATVTAQNIGGTGHSTSFSLTYSGTLTGAANSTLGVTPGVAGNNFGGLAIDRASANPYFGKVNVFGNTAANRGTLLLSGNSPLGNAALVDIQNHGTVLVQSNGGLNNIDEVRTQNGGFLRFRNNLGSLLDGTMLSGPGIVRSEDVSTDPLANNTVRSLTLTNGMISPGLSPGVLTFQVTTLTLGAGSGLEVELGVSPDLIAVQGNLTLTAGSSLELSGGAGFANGTYAVATYTGTLSGVFGSIVNDLPNLYMVMGIDYGVLTAGTISVTVQLVPEPSSLALLGLGVVGMAVRARRRRNM